VTGVGHVECMWKMKNTYKTSDGMSEGRRFLGRKRKVNSKRNLNLLAPELFF